MSWHSFLCRDVGCKTVANMIKGKTPEEIRKLFNIVNDFTPEEEVSLLGRIYWILYWISLCHRHKSKRRMYEDSPPFSCLKLTVSLFTGMGRGPMILCRHGRFVTCYPSFYSIHVLFTRTAFLAISLMSSLSCLIIGKSLISGDVATPSLPVSVT